MRWLTWLTSLTSAPTAKAGKVRAEWDFDSGRFCKAAHLRIANPILFRIASRHLSSGSVATYPCKRRSTSPSSISCRPSSVETKQNHNHHHCINQPAPLSSNQSTSITNQATTKLHQSFDHLRHLDLPTYLPT